MVAVIGIKRPTHQEVNRLVGRQQGRELSYPAPGSSLGVHPSGFRSVIERRPLGRGDFTFERLAAGMRRWAMFDTGWTVLYPASPRLAPGTTVGVLARALGMWFLNVCRVVRVDERPGRFAFAYGTTPAHVVSGEEAFLVERDGATDLVYFEVRAFSRPRHPLAYPGAPVLRAYQGRFVEDVFRAMQRVAVG